MSVFTREMSFFTILTGFGGCSGDFARFFPPFLSFCFSAFSSLSCFLRRSALRFLFSFFRFLLFFCFSVLSFLFCLSCCSDFSHFSASFTTSAFFVLSFSSASLVSGIPAGFESCGGVFKRFSRLFSFPAFLLFPSFLPYSQHYTLHYTHTTIRPRIHTSTNTVST